MRNTQAKGMRLALSSVLMLGTALTYGLGCGGDEAGGEDNNPPQNPPATEPTPDSVTPDSGTPTTPPALANDTDLAIVRLNADGSLDTSFGTGGIARLDMGPGASSAKDALWSAALDASGRVILFGSKKGSGDRIDADRVIARLTPAGALDKSFGTDGYNVLNIGNLADQARHGGVDPDGKIVASGYTSQPTGVGVQMANRIVLTRVDADGKLDNTFGSKGVVNSAPLLPADPLNQEWGFAEAYASGYQSGKYVTTGYGRSAATGTLDVVAFRYGANGRLDRTWGTDGALVLDVAGGDDRGRDLTVLPDDRVFMVGSTVKTTNNVDAMVFLLTKDGQRDTRFSSGADAFKSFDFSRTDEAFFKSAVSPDGKWVAAAGYTGNGASAAVDDALLFIAPVNPAEGAEFAQPVPLSNTGNDRFWSVTFDAANKVYGAGFINEGGDQRFAVARFNTDGSRDTTFGTGGLVTVNVIAGATEETVRAVLVQADGKIVLAGVAEAK